MKYFKNNITRKHIITFFAIFIIFTILTFLIINAGLDKGRVFKTTIGVIAGPMTGAIARNFQSCCTQASLTVMKFCAPILIFCIAFQFIKLPQKKWLNILRIIIWGIGWFIWFSGGIVSFGHALG